MITAQKAELIGIIMGDGYIHKHGSSYRIGIVGDPSKDQEYFKKIKNLIFAVWEKEVKIVKRERGLRIVFGSKRVFNELVSTFHLPYGKGKSLRVKIPSQIYRDWNLAKHTLRGLVDTDGSIFTANKPRFPNYPTIELNTSSYSLICQLRSLLVRKGFRVTKIWSRIPQLTNSPGYKIALNGHKNIIKWFDEIGFSNPSKFLKALTILKRKLGPVGISEVIPHLNPRLGGAVSLANPSSSASARFKINLR